MNIQTAFPNKYLKAVDLGTAHPVVTIDRVEMDDVGDDRVPVMYFRSKEKALVLNRTNANTIAEIAGSHETDTWRGVAIQLYATKTDYQGKRVDCIRVERPAAAAVSPPAMAVVHRPAASAAAVATSDPLSSDDIPFTWLLPILLPLAAMTLA